MTEQKESEEDRKRCQHCGDKIPIYKRPDARFCDNSCRSAFWRKRKEWENLMDLLMKNFVPLVLTIHAKKKPSFFKRIWRKVFPPLAFFNFLQ
jgi:hypothetical protein